MEWPGTIDTPRDADPQRTLLRLMTWLSPAFPVGAFAYSHSLERAVHDGLIHDRASLTGWLTDVIACGSGWNDAVLLAESWRAGPGDDAQAVAELAAALAGSRERHLETTQQGDAFAHAAGVWEAATGLAAGAEGDGPAAAVGLAHPVAVGRTVRRHAIPLEAVLVAYLHAFASNLVQAAVRIVPLGQRDGVASLASLEAVLLDAASRAAGSTLDDLGSSTLMSEIAAMRHEEQYSRVFRS